jgi:methionine transaminase
MPEFKGTIPSKLPRVGTTIFSVMSRLAADHGAINLSQGFPDFDIDPALRELVLRAMHRNLHQYAPMQGVPELRALLSRQLEERHARYYHPQDEINITSGATQALFTAITALVREEDEVILFAPAYDCYAPAIELAGGVPVWVTLKGSGFEYDWEEVKKKITRKTRMIVINSPHNPGGRILTKEDIWALEKLTKDTNIIILSDEVYEFMTFDGQKHLSMASSAELSKRSMIVGSFGKTLHATGWKIGYISGPGNLMAEFRKVHQYNVFCTNTPLQYAIAEYLEDRQRSEQIRDFYQAKRDQFWNEIKASRWTGTPAQGAYFQVLNYSAITDEADTDFAVRLVKEHKIAAVPLSVFYPADPGHRLLRFCFAKKEETLLRAAEILRSL